LIPALKEFQYAQQLNNYCTAYLAFRKDVDLLCHMRLRPDHRPQIPTNNFIFLKKIE
jgi:hypothetical protein